MIRVSIWTAFFLIVLRVCIGWHFFFEGVGKVKSAYMGKSIANEKPFSSDAFFKESEGWFGKQMKKWIGDPDQELVDNLTLEPRLGDAAQDSDKDRFPKALGKEWDEYLTRFVSQFHLDDATKARAETKLALAKSKYVKWVQGFSDEIDSESKKPKKLTLKVKRKAPGGSATADFDQEMIVSARLAELLKKSAEVRSVYDQKLPLLGKEVGGADLRAMKQDVATIRAELQKEIETQTTAMKDDLASVFDNRVTGFAKKVDNKDETATLQSMLTPIKAGQNPLGRLWNEYADYVKDFAPGLNEAQKADIDPRLKAAEERFDRWLADRDETTAEPSTSKEVAEWRQNYAAAIAKQSAATTALAGQKEPLKTDIEATKKYQVFTLAKAETDADVKTLTTQMQAELKLRQMPSRIRSARRLAMTRPRGTPRRTTRSTSASSPSGSPSSTWTGRPAGS